jgi:hypothetical protein
MVSEFGCRASDSGMLNTVGAGPVFLTQAERVACYKRNAEAMLKLPFMIGYHMFAWVDEPAAGNGWKENSNYGLVHLTDEPYTALTAMFTALNHQAATMHATPDAFPAAATTQAFNATSDGGCPTRMACRLATHLKADDPATATPHWAVIGAPDKAKPLCGFEYAKGRKLTTVYRATRVPVDEGVRFRSLPLLHGIHRPILAGDAGVGGRVMTPRPPAPRPSAATTTQR